ncbi:immunoglobulin superfamily member 10-like [Montipora capricornis]|uniref:immunoglobulin superfamily member 10-like n=1 Tax=Montipora capricornis TaxID=246305 RepID=UPI0035F17527
MKPLTVSLFFVIQGLSRFSDGSSITWYEPPPIQTVSDTDVVDHLGNSTQLLEGSINASLSWNFSLSSDLSFSALTVSLGGTIIAGVVSSGPAVQAGFGNKFDIRWIPFQRVTLIIFNVTTEVNGTFSCTITATKGFGVVNFGSNIQVHVVDPPSNIVTSRNITITAPDELTLNCSADGKPKPTRTWTRLSDNTVVNMPLNITGKQDAGGYRCTVDNGVGSPLTKDVFIAVLVRPKIDYLSSDWDVCENSTVILSCNATGEPTPNITWKRVADDEILPAVDGVYVIDSIKRNSSGRYCCKADNGVGIDSKTVNVTVRFAASVDQIINSSNTVNEGGFFNMTCQASDNPLPTTYTWINKDGQLFSGSVLNFTSISRTEAGQYICEVKNQCGLDGRNTHVNVYYNPATVHLVTNTTENENCSDFLVIRCTCKVSEANPPVENYQLLKNQEIVDTSSKGTWITTISSKGNHIYSCKALHPLGNVASADVTVTFNVPVQIFVHVQSGSETLLEGGNVSLYCNASGYPEPTVTWTKLNADDLIVSNQWLNFTIISKEASGEYICSANNTCGKNRSSVRTIDVQYKPENVHLSTSSRKICAGKMVILTCSAGDSNPAVDIFTLYKNGLRLANVTRANVGVFNQMLYTQGQHIYSCVAGNAVGNASSSNTIVEVEAPASVTVENRTIVVREGDNLTLHCISSGFPQPNVTWVNNSNYIMEAGSILNLTNISRHIPGFNCSASNACGNDSRKVEIDVQYAAEATGKGRNYSVPEGSSKLFSCLVDGNPEPNITWYKGSKAGGTVISIAKQLEARETGCYTCSASNSLGTPVTITQCLTVVPEEPTSASPTSTGQPPKQFYAALTIMEDFVSEYRDLNNQVSKQLVDSFVSEMDKIYQNDDNYLRTEVTGLRSGSVIVSFILYFKNAVTPCQGISKLEAAISNGIFGTYQVGNLTLLSPGTSTSVKSTTPRTSQPTEFQCACDTTLLVIIGVLVAIIIVLILVIAWQHRKLGIARKKRLYKVAEDKERRIYDVSFEMENAK